MADEILQISRMQQATKTCSKDSGLNVLESSPGLSISLSKFRAVL